jgi:hypothetical protein
LRAMTSGAENHASMWFMFCVLSSDVTPDSHTRAKDGNETRDASQTSICQSKPKYCLSVDCITDAKRAFHRLPGAVGAPSFAIMVVMYSLRQRVASRITPSSAPWWVGTDGHTISAASKQERIIFAHVFALRIEQRWWRRG